MVDEARLRHRELPRWVLPAIAAVIATVPFILAALDRTSWAQASRMAVLAGEVPLVFLLFCCIFQVGRRRELLWATFYVLSTAGALVSQQLLVGWLVVGHLAFAGLLCVRAWRDGFVQIRRAVIALEREQMERANLAYGRYLILGRTLGPREWEALRRTTIRNQEALRPRFAGMVNANRYGDQHGLGDLAYAGLFPDAGESRASAEEG